MYEVSPLVVYGMHGVCRIVDTESRTVDLKTVSYFVLEPLAQAGTRFYLPCHNSAALAKLRSLISLERLQNILRDAERELTGELSYVLQIP